MNCNTRLLTAVVFGVCLTALLSGCAKAPVEELAAAKAAVAAAKAAEADIYMPNNYKNVQKALSMAEAEMTLQEQKFALSRNYKKAIGYISNATTLATQLKEETPGAKEAMTEQVQKNLAAAKEIAKETRVEIRKAPRSKGKDVLAQMAVDIDAADGFIAEADKEFAAGNVPSAAKKLAQAHKMMKKISDRLSTGGAEGLM